MAPTPNRARSLSIAKSESIRRASEKKRFNALIQQILLASMHNKLPAHLKKNNRKK